MDKMMHSEILDAARIRRIRQFRPRFRPNYRTVYELLSDFATRRIAARRAEVKEARRLRKLLIATSK